MATAAILILSAAIAGLLLLVIICLGVAVQRPGNRQARIRTEAMDAEGRIDFLTRQTMQQMRDAVRAELRDRGDGLG